MFSTNIKVSAEPLPKVETTPYTPVEDFHCRCDRFGDKTNKMVTDFLRSKLVPDLPYNINLARYSHFGVVNGECALYDMSNKDYLGVAYDRKVRVITAEEVLQLFSTPVEDKQKKSFEADKTDLPLSLSIRKKQIKAEIVELQKELHLVRNMEEYYNGKK
jgi:hypothetical protein